MTKHQLNTQPPLFDRLSANAPDFLDEYELKQSIYVELSRLLNSRSQGWTEGVDLKDSPFFYGLPDFSHPIFEHTQGLEKFLFDLIAFYEPRLSNLCVKIDDREFKQRKIYLDVKGEMKLGERVISVSFPFTLEQ